MKDTTRGYASKSLIWCLILMMIIPYLTVTPHKASANDRENVSAVFGEVAYYDGITAWAGDNPDGLQTGSLNGKTYWQTSKENTVSPTIYFYMNVDDDYLLDNGDYDVEVEVEYFDQGNGLIVLQYDSATAAFKGAPAFQYGDSRTWKKHVFRLKDAKFANRANGADFRIGVEGAGADWRTNADLKLASIRVTKKLRGQPAEEKTIRLGEEAVADGITAWAGDSPESLESGAIGGKTYWKTNRLGSEYGAQYFYMNVDDDYLFENTDQDVWITIEYFDRGNGSIALQYDAVGSAFKETNLFAYGDSETWKKITFKLSDAKFANRTNGADFRIGITGAGAPETNPDMYIASVAVSKVPRAIEIEARTAVQTTQYTTEDVVIADYNVRDNGLAGDGSKDETEALQNILDAAGAGGGGVVYLPAGHYRINGHLVIPSGVTLRGDWANPERENGLVKGTVLEAYEGRGIEGGTSFIQMQPSSGLTNLSVWYPEQAIDQVAAYPWTVEQLPGDNATIENVTLVNSYNGIKIGPLWNELHYVKSLYGTVLNTGLFLDFTTDIGRLEDIHLNPDIWSGSRLQGAPERQALFDYTTSHGEGIVMGRSDWEYMSEIYLSGFKTGIRVTTRTNSSETANAQMYRVFVKDTNVALKIEGVNSYGLLVTDSIFEAGIGIDPIAIHATSGFQTLVQFNTVTVSGASLVAVKNDGDGVLSFENSLIRNSTVRPEGYAIELTGGSIILGKTLFDKPGRHLKLDSDAKRVLSADSGYDRALDILDNSLSAEIHVEKDTNMELDPLPQIANTSASVKPRPATNQMINVAAEPYRIMPGTVDDAGPDISATLQTALNDALQAGGGTVYVPAGIYRLSQPVTVPIGVELRGSWDVPHHTIGGGTVFFTDYGRGDDRGSDTALISLERKAGVRGFSVYYDDQNWMAPHSYSWTIRGLGERVYALDVTLINPYRGLDFGTYDTSGHYVDYLAGSPQKEGIFIGGGAQGGIVKNVQFNPHFYGRNLYKNFPPTEPDLFKYWDTVKESLDAIRVGDVKDQVIFNTFVFGSKYGLHFVEQDGRAPEAIVVGHGTDGSKKGIYIEAGGSGGLKFVNSELVAMETQDKVYITLTDSFKSHAVFYNTSMWGNPTRSIDMSSGKLKMQQLNVTNVSSNENVGVNARSGEFKMYNSYFQQANIPHLYADATIESMELTNNLFNGGMNLVNHAGMKVSGTNLVPIALELVDAKFDPANPQWSSLRLKLTNQDPAREISGQIEWIIPDKWRDQLVPIRFKRLYAGQSLNIPLPHLANDSVKYKVMLDSGKSYYATLKLAQAFASRYCDCENSSESLDLDHAGQYVGTGAGWGGTEDLSAKTTVQWDDEYLYLTVKARDAQHSQTESQGNIWSGDSLQLGIDLSRKEGVNSRNVNELGFALGEDGTVTKWRWRAPTNVQNGELTDAIAQIARDDVQGRTTYAIKIPFAALHKQEDEFDPSEPIGLSILLNDSDNGIRKGFMELNGGIGLSKDSTAYGALYLLPDSYRELLETSAETALRQIDYKQNETSKDAAVNFVRYLPDGGVKTRLLNQLGSNSIPNTSVSPSSAINGALKNAASTGPKISFLINSVPGDKDGIAQAVLTAEELKEIQLKSDPAASRITLRIGSSENAKGYEIKLPAAILAGDQGERGFQISTDLGSVVVPGGVVGAAVKQQIGDFFSIRIRKPDTSNWSKELKARVEGYPALEVRIQSNGREMRLDQPIKVRIPYKPNKEARAHPHQIVAWTIDEKGKIRAVPHGFYDVESQQMIVKSMRDNLFFITFVEVNVRNIDRAPWARTAIEAMVARGLFSSAGDMKFELDSPMTRGDLLSELVYQLELSATGAISKEFQDVPGTATYIEASRVASALGIARGYGEMLKPEQYTTRSDAATFIYRAFKAGNVNLPEGTDRTLLPYEDQDRIRKYAQAGFASLVEAGYLKGSGGVLRPDGLFTRAELAMILYRYFTEAAEQEGHTTRPNR